VWSGNDIVITFEFDSTLSQNQYANEFIVHAIGTNGSEGYSKPGYFKVNKSSSSQSITFTRAINTETMHGFTVAYTSFCIYAVDTLGINTAGEVCVASFPSYVSGLSTPTISVSEVNNGYTVSYTTPTSSSFVSIEISEYESSSLTAPTGVTYNVVYLNNLNPIVIISPNLNKRWVKARFVDIAGGYTAYSTIYPVTPKSTINVDQIPPNEVVTPTAVWNGDNVDLTFTMPAEDAPVRVIVQLQSKTNTSAYGYFYFDLDTAPGSKTVTISKRNMYLQFGQYFASFNGKVSGYDSSGNLSNGVIFDVSTRPNPMSSVQATATITAQPDGYTAIYDFSGTAATHAEIYEFYTSTTQSFFSEDLPDFYNGIWSSGGSANSTSLALTSFTREGGSSPFDPSQYIGYIVSGYGIPINTHVVSISGSGPTYTFTLNNALTAQATGNYQFTGLIYSGGSPANIYSAYYQPRYVVVVWYDDYDNNSITRAAQSITPLDPGAISLISNPITFSTNGSILAGDSPTATPRAVLNKTGLYVYDANGNQTTQILGNALNGGNTFVTTRAQIADFSIKNTTIQNDLHISGNNYIGLSGSGTYAIWAGASQSENAGNDALFSVTSLGAVTAKNITITGSGSGTLINAGGVFTLTNAGVMTITGSAEITGKLHVTEGSSFDGNITIGAAASIKSGTVGAGSGNAGYILNTSGLRFDNGSTQGVTQIVASTGKLITSSASIGGWNIDSSTISKTSSSGPSSTLSLDSSSAIIKASSAAYSAGIKTPTSNSATDITFWSGNVTTPSTSASFYVTADGTMNAAKANITGGIINATGSLGKIVIDADHQFIQFGNSGNTYNAYLMPRAVQGGTALILTGTTPFVGGSPYSYAVTDDLLNAHPYLSIGPTTNSFGKIMEGIGLYTTNAYINVTESNGIGISTVNNLSGSTYYANQILLSSGSLKLNSGTTTISNGVETNTKISSQMLVDSKTITLQTWTTDNVSTPTTGSQIVLGQGTVTIGARSSASGTGKIIVSDKYVTTQVSSSNFIVVGDITSQLIANGGNLDPSGISSNNQTIVLQASNSRVNGIGSSTGGDGVGYQTSAYQGPSRIVLDSQYGVGIWGIPVQGDVFMYDGYTNYMQASPLGPLPRQRMLVENPKTGQTQVGMAVYYQDLSGTHTSVPGASSGYIGDLWVSF
jgi:hypothetical protein